MTIEEFNRLPSDEARAALERCCGCTRWVGQMVSRRPFVNLTHLMGIANASWMRLAPDDWREAFGHHPRIGGVAALRQRFSTTADLASREQAGAAGAPQATLEALSEGNRAYEERFGYIFIVFASGRSADEMLSLLRQRLGNDPDAEVKIAAKEQWKIMRLRLDRLLAGPR